MVSNNSYNGNNTGGNGPDVNNGNSGRPQAPFITLIKSRIRQPQFYWFLGHLLTLYHFVRFHLSFLSIENQNFHYSMALLYISLTYAIVLYQFYKSGQLKFNYLIFLKQLKKLDNLQYFLMLSILFVCSNFGSMVNGSLYSPVIFSLFHCLNYFKENLLPFLPINNILKNIINNNITNFIQNYNGYFLQMAQFFEIICALRSGLISLPIKLIKSILLFNFNSKNISSIISLCCYIWFFKLRFQQSQSMKNLFNHSLSKVDSMIPPNFLINWQHYKILVKTTFDRIPTPTSA
ncbi:hypothetical protein Kpol_1023p22 [Vanderwaltozyma polyspora DSM 70294]|uniref:Pore and endoplasmic reticulum protein of 33 kDa n=1 Tax=Vanderwaltozyma polyspora (strain ATCC 22028 / DSM 70294 / BCRC 21397 / CBS 2163 / NBRC 10782 / NRRL Y-8283 / UCD 57-17) TaxID=436907 RepID=A7TFP5_VANPO|nr:uncharacterized protein Kpol_1023p22 [Vanderwaltozyma polyspora DSM 70294]EDO18853.1 hypothetical protein Kpol_1023p22 [Vanderwaltozyma polyspora DSM 70294]